MASPRERAASIATARFSFTFFCPMNSLSRCGRSLSSNEESSSTGAAETRRARLGLRLGSFFAVATASDGRTKCETAQLLAASRGIHLNFAVTLLIHTTRKRVSMHSQGLQDLVLHRQLLHTHANGCGIDSALTEL